MLKDDRIKKVENLPIGNWLPVVEAAKYLNISYQTVYQRARLGNIKALNWRGITFVLVDNDKTVNCII